MNQRRRIIGILAFGLISVMAGLLPPLFSARAWTGYKVLIIHAFHRGDRWDDDLGLGIKQGLDASGLDIELAYEYMDSQRFGDDKTLALTAALYAHKYQNNPPDIIATTDETALKFILARHHEIFPGIPVVFCGIKFFDDNWLYGEKDITGIVEKVDMDKNIRLARQLNPATRNLLVVADNSDTSIATIKAVLSWLKHHPGTVNVEFTPLLTMAALGGRLERLPSDTAVLLVNFTEDLDGRRFSSDQSASIISRHSPVPVYTLWDNYLSRGVLGGHLISARAEGRKTADLIVQRLENKSAVPMPVLRHFASKYVFDFKQLKRHRIDLSRLPQESRIINRPFSFYDHYKRLIYITLLGTVCLVFIIVFLSLNIAQRRRTERALTRSSRRLDFLYKADEMILNSASIDTMAQKTLALSIDTFSYLMYAIVIREGNHHRIFAGSRALRSCLAKMIDADDRLFEAGSAWPDDPFVFGLPPDATILFTPIRARGQNYGALIYGTDRHRENLHLEQVNEDLARSLATACANFCLKSRSKQYEQELKQVSAHLINAQETERKHLSHELHDELGQAMTAIGLNLRLVKRNVEKNDARHIITLLEETEVCVKNMADQVHDMSLDLRPPMLDDLGLVATARWYLARCEQRTGLTAVFHARGNIEAEIPGTMAVALYRVLQETLNNIVKYAAATRVEVILRIGPKGAELAINDDGKGFSTDQIRQEAIGIFGMRERLQALGGTLAVQSAPGAGTAVVASIRFGRQHERHSNFTGR